MDPFSATANLAFSCLDIYLKIKKDELLQDISAKLDEMNVKIDAIAIEVQKIPLLLDEIRKGPILQYRDDLHSVCNQFKEYDNMGGSRDLRESTLRDLIKFAIAARTGLNDRFGDHFIAAYRDNELERFGYACMAFCIYIQAVSVQFTLMKLCDEEYNSNYFSKYERQSDIDELYKNAENTYNFIENRLITRHDPYSDIYDNFTDPVVGGGSVDRFNIIIIKHGFKSYTLNSHYSIDVSISPKISEGSKTLKESRKHKAIDPSIVKAESNKILISTTHKRNNCIKEDLESDSMLKTAHACFDVVVADAYRIGIPIGQYQRIISEITVGHTGNSRLGRRISG